MIEKGYPDGRCFDLQVRDCVLAHPFTQRVRSLIAVITTLNEQVKALQGQVEDHFGQHPDAEIYRSRPGMGAIVGILHGCLKTRTRYDEATAWSHRQQIKPAA